jgi:WD40 repeat protein
MRRWFFQFRSVIRAVATVSVVTCWAAAPARAEFGEELFKLTASDAAMSSHFGTHVAISGSTAIVGAWANDAAGDNAGAAYVFDVTTGQELRKLTASDAAPGDEFGRVAISGNIALVGARSNDDNGDNSGSAYLFDVTTGQELRKLIPSDAGAGDQFGRTVSISANRALIGAAGKAYLFDVTTGQELFTLTASGAAMDFGRDAAISGNTAIIGAAGEAYLFDVTTGHEMFTLTASDQLPWDSFGRFVSISGNTATVGAPVDGMVYAFDATTGNELRKFSGSGPDSFGWVGVSGNIALVGAPLANSAGGSAYLFDVMTGEELRKLVPSDPAAHYFGARVAIGDKWAVVGAPYTADAGPFTGAAYVFDVSRNLSTDGDFNADGTVDAADYIVWRNGLGTTYSQTDYDAWRANFGRPAAGAAAVALGASSPSSAGTTNPAVPEPATTVSLAIAAAGLLVVPRRRSPIRKRYRISWPTD